MEIFENSENTFKGFSELINPDDCTEEQIEVSMSSVRAKPWRHNRLVAVCLSLLGVVLIAVDISLVVRYTKLREGHLPLQDNITQISIELAKLRDTHMTTLRTRDEASRRLTGEVNQHKVSKWDLEHQKRRTNDYNQLLETINSEKVALQSLVILADESCKRCMTGWTHLNSKCYYFPFFSTMTRRSWREAMAHCRTYGADLAMIDSIEEQLSISKVINEEQVHSRSDQWSGFWIGLTEQQGTWRWQDGTPLTNRFWLPGEPSDFHEKCGATYARQNPLQTWNNAPCGHPNRWICEMEPLTHSLMKSLLYDDDY